MKLLLDTANLEKIKALWERYPLDGVTTNPSILAKEGRPPYQVLRSIRQYMGPDAELHVQVAASAAEGMVEDAHRILRELGEGTYVKIPAVPEGFRAMKSLCAQGVRVTATGIYTAMQGFLAAKCGASYAAPYVNRIDNLGYDGVQVAKDIHDIFQKNGLGCQVLAASFQNTRQVLELCRYGVGAVTAAPEVIEGFVNHPGVDKAVAAFLQDFEKLAGAGKTMANC